MKLFSSHKEEKRSNLHADGEALSPSELVKKVKELEIKSKRISTHLFSGEYHSAFKGKGMRFREVREYADGDDIRFIDWNVSARFSHPFTKLFEEERELTMMLVVDLSASNLFGTTGRIKKDLITEIASMLAFSAISNNDKAGVIFFSDRVEKYIPPKKGRPHALYISRELLTAQPASTGTNLGEAIRFFNNTTRQKSIVFLLSDFIDSSYQDDLKVIGKKHDVIGINVYDKMDMDLPNVGLLQLEDIETGAIQLVDSGNRFVRQAYHRNFFIQNNEVIMNFRNAGADLLHIRTDEDYIKVLQKFFVKRK